MVDGVSVPSGTGRGLPGSLCEEWLGLPCAGHAGFSWLQWPHHRTQPSPAATGGYLRESLVRKGKTLPSSEGSQKGWGWKGPLEVFWSKHPAQAGPPKASCPEPWPDGFSICPGMEIPQPPRAICPRAQSLTPVKKCFPMFRWKLPCFNLCPLSLSVTGHHWKQPYCILFAPTLQVLKYIDKIHTHISTAEPSLLKAKQSQLSQLPLEGEMLQSHTHFCGPSVDSLQCVHVSFALRSLELDTAVQV